MIGREKEDMQASRRCGIIQCIGVMIGTGVGREPDGGRWAGNRDDGCEYGGGDGVLQGSGSGAEDITSSAKIRKMVDGFRRGQFSFESPFDGSKRID